MFVCVGMCEDGGELGQLTHILKHNNSINRMVHYKRLRPLNNGNWQIMGIGNVGRKGHWNFN